MESPSTADIRRCYSVENQGAEHAGSNDAAVYMTTQSRMYFGSAVPLPLWAYVLHLSLRNIGYGTRNAFLDSVVHAEKCRESRIERR